MACRFGPHTLSLGQVFFETALSRAFVNIKPIVPGHVLVTPKRPVLRMKELTADELVDLFSSVQHIGKAIEEKYGADALNIAVQDGPEAGQSVPHVHVHILPRRRDDFKRNDEVYEHLDNQRLDVAINQQISKSKDERMDQDKSSTKLDVSEHRPLRSLEDMAREAADLRLLFPKNAPKEEKEVDEKVDPNGNGSDISAVFSSGGHR